MLKKLSRNLMNISSRRVLEERSIRHYAPSLIYSCEDVIHSSFLIETLADAAKIATKNLLTMAEKELPDSAFYNIFPGEHYRLLNSIVKVLNAKNVVEIGTSTGLGTLCFLEGNPDVNVTTFDIVPWDKLHLPSHLSAEIFQRQSLRQIIGDLSDDNVFEQHKKVLDDADIIFMDAPKDDIFEYRMAQKFKDLAPRKGKLLIVDDIRFVNMIDFWRKISSPKIDATSFGHWSGTGLVDLTQGFKVVAARGA